LFDGVKPESWGQWAWLWQILHASGRVVIVDDGTIPGGIAAYAGYPLVPWIGVMAAGYAFGSIFQLDSARRRTVLIALGSGAIALFILLRGTNLYGDGTPWKSQATEWATMLSVLDCVKYPPSLNYLLMTLGPGLLILACLESGTPRVLKPTLSFGRVPLFFYLLHLPLIHGLSVLVHRLRFEDVRWLFSVPGSTPPPGAGFNLFTTYLVWVLVLVLLYPVCRWFAELKRRRKDAWLSYL